MPHKHKPRYKKFSQKEINYQTFILPQEDIKFDADGLILPNKYIPYLNNLYVTSTTGQKIKLTQLAQKISLYSS
jgi:hypothetical protein